MSKTASSTIHRLLKYVTASNSAQDPLTADDEEELEGTYQFNCENPLEADCLLVDEAAMLDVTLAAALLDALKNGTQLILVGKFQLSQYQYSSKLTQMQWTIWLNANEFTALKYNMRMQQICVIMKVETQLFL